MPSKIQNVRIDASVNTSGTTDTKAEVLVKEVPRISLETSTDYVAILSFVITAIVVAGSTWLTIRNYQRTIDFQEKIAEKDAELQMTKTRVDVLSKNRQDWINTLRNTIIDYISAALSLYQLHDIMYADAQDLGVVNKDEFSIVDIHHRIDAAKTEMIRLKTKIELLSNPYEEDFKKLIDALDKVEGAVFKIPNVMTSNFHGECRDLVSISQNILKKEWERVKRLE